MSAPALLTAHLFVLGQTAAAAAHQEPIQALIKRLREREIRAVLHSHDEDPRRVTDTDPSVYITIGGSDSEFPALFNLPLFERRRWVHYRDAVTIDSSAIYY